MRFLGFHRIWRLTVICNDEFITVFCYSTGAPRQSERVLHSIPSAGASSSPLTTLAILIFLLILVVCSLPRLTVSSLSSSSCTTEATCPQFTSLAPHTGSFFHVWIYYLRGQLILTRSTRKRCSIQAASSADCYSLQTCCCLSFFIFHSFVDLFMDLFAYLCIYLFIHVTI